MSTKQQTNQSSSNSLNYDPTSLGNYSSLTGSGTQQLMGMINNPFQNAMFNMGAGQAQKGAAQGGANNMSALQSMMKTSGMSGSAGQGFQMAQQGRMGRANQSMMGQANTSNVMNAMQRQMQATGMGMSFNPLLKGTTGNSQSTQTTGGLGTWLPQLLGAGLGAATGGMFGGGGGSSGPNATMSATQNMPSSQWGGASAYPGFAGMTSGVAQPPPMGGTPPLQWGMQ